MDAVRGDADQAVETGQIIADRQFLSEALHQRFPNE
jgi:hypothetical protein